MKFREFKNLIYSEYIPTMYEIYDNENVRPEFRSYCYSGIELYYEVFKLIKPFIKENTSFADIGAYPGTFLRIIKFLLKKKYIELNGLGLVCEEDEIQKYNNKADNNSLTKSIKTNLEFKDYMKENEGINFMDLNLDYCNSHLKNFSSHDLNKTFDIVSCMETIEHLHTPYLLFDKLNQITNQGGVCVVETNNVAYLKGIISLLKGGSNLDMDFVNKYSLKCRSIKHPHVRFYSLEEINSLFAKSGFRILKSYSYNWGYPLSVLRGKRKLQERFKRLNFIDRFLMMSFFAQN